MECDWDDSVSMRLACLALDRGRLTDDLVTPLAVRGALLVDLALRGRVAETAEAVEIDPLPSGFAPADRLLAGGGKSLAELLTSGPVDRTRADEQAMRSGPGREWTPTDAALTAIAGVLGLLPTGRTLPTEPLLAATGPARGIVELVVEEVDRRVVHGRAVRWADA
ncbi:hypothetical protein [Geodermatophilus sp. SYSU D01105]